MEHLKNVSIGTGIHYPIPLHLQKAYSSHGYAAGDFPVCEAAATQIVSLPMFPQLTGEQQDRVAREIQAFANKEATSAHLLEARELAGSGSRK
jgi:dTDP-4-amino-4,6-dideoxygalactose transaminase